MNRAAVPQAGISPKHPTDDHSLLRRCRWTGGLLARDDVSVLLAGCVGPADPVSINRVVPIAPPMPLRFVDATGAFHARPFVYRLIPQAGSLESFTEDRSTPLPVRFLVRGSRYEIAGLVSWDRHLFGIDEGAPILLLGTDGLGRDLFSRLLHGGRISLFAGLLGASLALGLGIVFGGVAGFYGGWLDDVVMRGAELFLALPWLYLLLAVRMSLPLHIQPTDAFLLIVIVVGVVGWARPARLIRGVVLSARARDYVTAARSAGASDRYLLRRHVLPQVIGVAATQAALLAPQYTLAEVTLSFFGLGVEEPVPSWGNMLAALQRYDVLASYWWMFVPGIALAAVFLLYYALSDAMHQRVAAMSL
jgi:peptide/nickel transport system permease protein